MEVGTYCGGSAISIAKTIQEWGGRLACIDPWESEPENLRECADNLVAHFVSDIVSLYVARSADVAARWADLIDFLYIDGDHGYKAVLGDLKAWWPHLVDGALLCGDDYDDPLSPGVAKAWDEFGQQVGHAWQQFATPDTTPPGMKLVWGIK